MNFKKLVLKIVCYYFSGIIKIEDFDFNLLLNEKLYENTLIHVL